MNAETGWMQDAPLVIAHRGASKVAPENTIAAFRRALELGADAIELDVKLSADRQVVVMHDRTLDRTTTGSGPVSGRSAGDIVELDAGSHFSAEFGGERVPTLRNVLETFGEELLYNIELTNYASPWDDLPRAVREIVVSTGVERRVLVSSFNPIALRKYGGLGKESPLALLVGAMQPAWLRKGFEVVGKHQVFHPQDGLVSQNMVGRKHGGGWRVNVWTVNDADRMRELLIFGVDGIITDVPDIARAVVSDLGEGSRLGTGEAPAMMGGE